MIKKLRKKFLLINMILVSLVLLSVFSALCYSSYRRCKVEVWGALARAVMLQSNAGNRPQIGSGPAGGSEDRGNLVPVVCVTVKDGALTEEEGLASISQETLEQATRLALASSEAQGELSALGLFFLRVETPLGTRIAFADNSSGFASFQSTLLISAGAFACSLAAFFVISLFLSRWALRPAEDAWLRQRQFVADASHELKTPLTVILANTGILLSHPESTLASQEKWVSNTRDEALSMKTLVEDMLLLAKADADEQPLVASEISFSELVLGAALPFEAVAFEQGVALESEIEPELWVLGDSAQLKQLCAILIDNACKYAGVGGSAVISLKKLGAELLLCVENNGPPIPPEELPHIFERFYRGDKARAQNGSFGLGLAIAYAIAQRHKGRLWAESGQSFGTRFLFQIKAAKKQEVPLPRL